MQSVDWPTLLIGAIPGCFALIGAAVGHGRAMQRLSRVETDVAKLSDLNAKVATIEERTRSMDDNMKNMREDVGRITGYLLDEARTFAARTVIPRRR